MISEKKLLKDVLAQDVELMTVSECFEVLDWTSEYGIGDERGTGSITCSCGTPVKTGGWVGPEHAWCPNCHKGMQDVTGLLPKTNSTVVHIDYDNTIIPDDGRVWIPSNVWNL